MTRVRVKVCCISSIEEAELAVRLGADALGLVSAMPSGPGVIDEAQIAAIAASVPPPLATFLLTSATNAPDIIAQATRCRTSVLQLVDAVREPVYHALRTALPGVKIVQVVHVTDDQALQSALSVAPFLDGLLLDSGNPGLPIKELGGTGRIHDWNLSRRIVEQCPRPVFLAGGLTAGNVANAIRTVRPFGVDVCSGVRESGRLDAEKLTAFMRAVSSGSSPGENQPPLGV